MLTSKSMRYGGLLIDASECDYNSFKQLGLLCPICNRPVFLVQAAQRDAHTRKSKEGGAIAVKESSIPAHFSHFQDVSKEQVADCELRSKQITVAQKQASANKAKGQRLKVLQSNLWKMIKTSFRLYFADGTDTLLENYFLEACIMNELRARAYLDKTVETCALSIAHPTNLAVVKDSFEYGCAKWDQLAAKYPGTDTEALYAGFKNWPTSVIDTKMHQAICLEVLDFLCTKMQRPILNTLVKYAIFNYVSGAAFMAYKKFNFYEIQEMINTLDTSTFIFDENTKPFLIEAIRSLIGADKDEIQALFGYVRDDVIQFIYFVNWAEQFENVREGVGNA